MYHPAQTPWNVSSEAKAPIDEFTRHDTRNWITTTLADVKFVDDACFSFEANNPVSLVNSATMLLQIVDETCEAHGLLVNINDGKTEFRNSRISLHLREQLAYSLCISRLKFGVETWLFTTPAATAQIHNVRMRSGRGLIGQSRFSSCDSTTDAEVFDELRWLPTDLLLFKERLSPLAKLYGWQSEQWDHFWTT